MGLFLLEEAEHDGETTPMMKSVIVGRDMRQSSPKLRDELVRGLTCNHGSVIDLGLVDTPMMYFAINYLGCCGGVQTSGLRPGSGSVIVTLVSVMLPTFVAT